jgi:uncharacterized repeat protein (TIGR01451 family)
LVIERTTPAQVYLNQAFDYTITITNISKSALHDLTITEPYSTLFKYQSAQPSPSSHQNGTLVWHLDTLDVQATRTVSVRGTATSSGRLSDCVTVSFTCKPKACADIDVVNPRLLLTQSGPETVIDCDPIPVTFTVTNNGTGVARNVMIKEELPQGLLTLDDSKMITAQVGDLNQGESKSVTVNLKAALTGKYELKAQALGQGGLESSATYAVTVGKPVLVLTKSGPEKRFVGRPATFDITVANKGNAQAKDLVVTDTIPEGATFVSATGGGQLTEGKVIWNLGSLAPGDSRKLSVNLKLNQVGTAVSKATANAHCAVAYADSSAQVMGIAAILLEVIDLEDPIEIGSNETYVISVTNQGSAVGTNIKIVATLPEELNYVTSTGPTQATISGKTISFVPLARLAPKAKAEYRVVIKGLKTGDVRFHVEMESDQMSSPVMETESTHVY